MGKPATDAQDLATGAVAYSATATGQSGVLMARGGLNVTISGTFVATLQLQRSFDGGTTWHPTSTRDGVTQRNVSAPLSWWEYEMEAGVLYRVACTAYTSGTAVCRLSC